MGAPLASETNALGHKNRGRVLQVGGQRQCVGALIALNVVF